MNERDFHTEENEREVTRSVPAVNDHPEETSGETRAPARRRRADRYRTETSETETQAETAGFTSKPVLSSGSETAREVANRLQAREPEIMQEGMPVRPGSRIPPQAARMSAASRIRLAAAQENRTENARSRERVGYAPGRMNESDRRPAYASRERNMAERPAGVPPQRTLPPMTADRRAEEPRKKHRGLTALVAALVVIGLLLVGIHLIPDDTAGFPGTVRQTVTGWLAGLTGGNGNSAPGITGFIASGYENTVAPTDVSLAVTTTKDIKGIRLADENGEVLYTSQMVGNNTEQTLWNLTWHVEDGYEGTVRLQVLAGEDWTDTEQLLAVSIASLPTVTAETAVQQESQPTPTEVPVVVATEEPTATPEPTAEPTEEPTELPEEETEEDPLPEAEGIYEDGGNLTEQDETGDEGEEPEETATLPPAKTPEPTEEPTPEVTERPKLTAKACEEADPALIATSVIYNGNKKASEYTRAAKDKISMPVAGEYTRQQMGVLTFRNDAFRQNAACGNISGAESLEVIWTADAGSVKGSGQTFYGISWTGQPAIVKWSKEVRELTDMYDSKKEKSGLKEVIVAGLDGTIYFLDLADGTQTRNSIKLGYPMKGSPSVHPGGAPYMNVGQYARKMARGTGKIGLRQFNLYTGKEMTLIDGLDGTNRRPFNSIGSFETSALMDRTSDSMITAGTNGMLYVITMGSTFDYRMGTYAQSPSTVLLKTKAKGESDSDTAVEASVAMYDKYVFYADMGGILRCVDTDTMRTVWAVSTEDSVESTVALDFNGTDALDLYTANILNRRKSGDATVRCYDAMSGAEKWSASFGVKKDTKNKTVSGFRASPVVGQNDLENLVYYTVNGLSQEGAENLGLSGETAALIALDKATGKTVWVKGLSGLAYSSPVAVYDENGAGWIVQCTGDGTVLLLEGLTGKAVSELAVEGSIEASPAVYNDTLVVGTTKKGANYIYGIRIQ